MTSQNDNGDGGSRGNGRDGGRPDWQDYYSYHRRGGGNQGHSIAGVIRVAPGVRSPQLGNERPILVYLPPSYGWSERAYPVIYMHDGQNLFDNATSYAGEWGVDEIMEDMARSENLEAIVVGVPNTGVHRLDEYSPFRDPRLGGGRGDRYLDFLVDTLKPLIDRDFRTLTDCKHTGIMGSSMGGLISLYAFFRHPDVFGFAGGMSPALWFSGGAIYQSVEAAAYRPGKIYLDAGTREMGEDDAHNQWRRASSRRYYASVRKMKRLLVQKGYRPFRDLLHVEEQWAPHSESAWGRRLPLALRFFLTEAYRETSG